MTPKPPERQKKAIEEQIDENLRRVYEQVAEAEIPDRFLDLLEKLKRQE